MSGQYELTPEERRKYEHEWNLSRIPASALDVEQIKALLLQILARLPPRE